MLYKILICAAKKGGTHISKGNNRLYFSAQKYVLYESDVFAGTRIYCNNVSHISAVRC